MCRASAKEHPWEPAEQPPHGSRVAWLGLASMCRRSAKEHLWELAE